MSSRLSPRCLLRDHKLDPGLDEPSEPSDQLDRCEPATRLSQSRTDEIRYGVIDVNADS